MNDIVVFVIMFGDVGVSVKSIGLVSGVNMF